MDFKYVYDANTKTSKAAQRIVPTEFVDSLSTTIISSLLAEQRRSNLLSNAGSYFRG